MNIGAGPFVWPVMRRVAQLVIGTTLLAALVGPANADRWRGHGRGRPAADQTRAALAACSSTFFGDSARGCIAEVSRSRHRSAAAVITACGNGFYSSSAQLDCVRTSLSGGVAPDVIPACTSAFYSSSDQQACLDAVAGTRTDASVVMA